MKFLVTDGAHAGRYAIVEVDYTVAPGGLDSALQSAAEIGVERMMAEWPGEYECRECEKPFLSGIHVYAVEEPTTFRIGHAVLRDIELRSADDSDTV